MQTRPSEIASLLSALNGSGSEHEWAAVRALRALPEMPKHLLAHYKQSKAAGARSACVYHATRFAAFDSDARTLGVLALRDRSKVVRYRAALLLAVSQDHSAIPELEAAAGLRPGEESAKDAEAAIIAIKTGDPNRYVDRDNTGMVTLHINRDDA